MSALFSSAVRRANAAVLEHLADTEVVLDGLVSARGVWREPHELALGMVDTSGPSVMVAADAHPEIRRGLMVERAGVDYRVIAAEPDGFGMVNLRLERA